MLRAKSSVVVLVELVRRPNYIFGNVISSERVTTEVLCDLIPFEKWFRGL